METAELALRGSDVPLTVLPELRELSLGQWEGCTVDDVRARDGDPYRAWLRAPHDCPPPDGEPLPDVHDARAGRRGPHRRRPSATATTC